MFLSKIMRSIKFSKSVMLTLLIVIVSTANFVQCSTGNGESENLENTYIPKMQPPKEGFSMKSGESRLQLAALTSNSPQYPALITSLLPPELKTKVCNSAIPTDTEITSDLARIEVLLIDILERLKFLDGDVGIILQGSVNLLELVKAHRESDRVDYNAIMKQFQNVYKEISDMQQHIYLWYKGQSDDHHRQYKFVQFVNIIMYISVGILLFMVILMFIMLCKVFGMIQKFQQNQHNTQKVKNEERQAPPVAIVCTCASSAYRIGEAGPNK